MPCQVLILYQNNLYVYCFHISFIICVLPILNPDKDKKKDVGVRKNVLEREYIHYKKFIIYNYMDYNLGSMSPSPFRYLPKKKEKIVWCFVEVYYNNF